MGKIGKNVADVVELQVVAQAVLEEKNSQDQKRPAQQFYMMLFDFGDNNLIITTMAANTLYFD